MHLHCQRKLFDNNSGLYLIIPHCYCLTIFGHTLAMAVNKISNFDSFPFYKLNEKIYSLFDIILCDIFACFISYFVRPLMHLWINLWNERIFFSFKCLLDGVKIIYDHFTKPTLRNHIILKLECETIFNLWNFTDSCLNDIKWMNNES